MTVADFLNAFDIEQITIRSVFICRNGHWANEFPYLAPHGVYSMEEITNNSELLDLTVQRWTIEEYYDDYSVALGICVLE